MSTTQYTVVVTSKNGKVIRMAPRETIGRARKEAKLYQRASWVRCVVVETEEQVA